MVLMNYYLTLCHGAKETKFFQKLNFLTVGGSFGLVGLHL